MRVYEASDSQEFAVTMSAGVNEYDPGVPQAGVSTAAYVIDKVASVLIV